MASVHTLNNKSGFVSLRKTTEEEMMRSYTVMGGTEGTNRVLAWFALDFFNVPSNT